MRDDCDRPLLVPSKADPMMPDELRGANKDRPKLGRYDMPPALADAVDAYVGERGETYNVTVVGAEAGVPNKNENVFRAGDKDWSEVTMKAVSAEPPKNLHFERVKERAKELYAFMSKDLAGGDLAGTIDTVDLMRLAHDMVVQEAREARYGHETYMLTRRLLQKNVPKTNGIVVGGGEPLPGRAYELRSRIMEERSAFTATWNKPPEVLCISSRLLKVLGADPTKPYCDMKIHVDETLDMTLSGFQVAAAQG